MQRAVSVGTLCPEPERFRQETKTPTPPRGCLTGVPAEPQRSGFGGERTSSGMSELAASAGSEGYGACEDEGPANFGDFPSLERHPPEAKTGGRPQAAHTQSRQWPPAPPLTGPTPAGANSLKDGAKNAPSLRGTKGTEQENILFLRGLFFFYMFDVFLPVVVPPRARAPGRGRCHQTVC